MQKIDSTEVVDVIIDNICIPCDQFHLCHPDINGINYGYDKIRKCLCDKSKVIFNFKPHPRQPKAGRVE